MPNTICQYYGRKIQTSIQITYIVPVLHLLNLCSNFLHYSNSIYIIIQRLHRSNLMLLVSYSQMGAKLHCKSTNAARIFQGVTLYMRWTSTFYSQTDKQIIIMPSYTHAYRTSNMSVIIGICYYIHMTMIGL